MVVINNLKCSIGQKKLGVQFGGDYILDNFENSKIKKINHFLFKNNNSYIEAYKQIYLELSNNKFCINLGGDHSVGICTVQAVLDLYKDDVLIIWIDAHGDINTPETSPSQNKHGMPVAGLMNLMENWLGNVEHVLKPKNIVYVGVRDLDPGETDFIKKFNIKRFNSYSDEFKNYVNEHPAKKIHISCDIDGFDPIYMPSTGTKSNNGLCMTEIVDILNITNNRLCSFDLVEFNPLIGNQSELDKTLQNIIFILSNLFDYI